MAEKAYIELNEDNCWTLYLGDGTEDEKIVLAVGRPFEPGPDIRFAMEELEQWAWENGYELDAPYYSKNHDVIIEDVIEPEVFDEVFGAEGEDDEE
ncbi:MAG: hypothetical protein D6737_18175 [Chloroflexi bacterium]|nr:MAG: hypothetical protein D6737_18175 [Chloroflexota bacterium]